MRWRAALSAASVAGCSAGASAPPTSAPPSTPTTTAIRPAPTTTLPSTSTSNDATPVRLRISVGIDGSYPGGSLSHVEVFRFFPESDAFPVPVLVANTLGDPDVADTEVDRGTYEVRTYQRPCAESCAVLEPPADGCAVGMEIAGTRPVNVHITVRPGQACEADVTGAAATEPARSMDLTLAEPGGPGCDPTQTGCWNLHVTRGADVVDAWVEVGGRD